MGSLQKSGCTDRQEARGKPPIPVTGRVSEQHWQDRNGEPRDDDERTTKIETSKRPTYRRLHPMVRPSIRFINEKSYYAVKFDSHAKS
jgi:hypothetical protein